MSQSTTLRVVLFNPQIPQNTGNILRTCSVTGTKLTLIPPLGFSLSEKALRRAGLDYIQEVDVSSEDSLSDIIGNSNNPIILSSHGKLSFFEEDLTDCDTIIFGNETSGIGSENQEKYSHLLRRIPMISNKRCLNLSNSVALCLYEVYRQKGFPTFS